MYSSGSPCYRPCTTLSDSALHCMLDLIDRALMNLPLSVCLSFQDLLGIAYNRLILMDINTMETKKTWRYSAMKSWNVNWESKQLRVDHEEEKLLFQCLSADLKIVHEFIGGNIWLSLRNDKDPLDLSMFVKLTGGVTNNLSGWGSETMARFLAQ